MKSAFRLSIAASILVIAAGCATQGDIQDAAPVEDRSGGSQTSGTTAGTGTGAEASGAQVDARVRENDPLNPPADSPLAQRVIYFEYDSSDLRPEFQDVLRAHGAALAANPNVRVTVEGHTDERGSASYNLALGERRAASVKKILVLNGADAGQVTTVSFGEEKPAELGTSEEAMSKNRRAELNYER